MSHEATLLLVEDHLQSLEVARETLEEAGLAVLAADSLDAARSIIAGSHVDLAVVDVHLPDGDGIELLDDLRSKCSSPPVLVVSSDDRAMTRDRALSNGCAGFLVKPYRPETLLRAVRTLLPQTVASA